MVKVEKCATETGLKINVLFSGIFKYYQVYYQISGIVFPVFLAKFTITSTIPSILLYENYTYLYYYCIFTTYKIYLFLK